MYYSFSIFERKFNFSKKSNMQLIKLKPRNTNSANKKLNERYEKLQSLLEELHKRELPQKVTTEISTEIEKVNTIQDSAYKKQLLKSRTKILRILEKELKLVPKNYYRNLWLALGMSVFGIPMGAAFGVALDSMAFLGIGLPIGMVIGMAVGSEMDKKAAKENRQLNIDS